YMGPGNRKIGYLRPETAQGMFLLFNRLYGFHRKKLPFGVAQLGKAYRNEISPRQGIIRLREFSQAEVELFVHPDEKKHSRFKEFAREALNLTPKDGREKSMNAGEAVKKGIVSSELLAYHLVIAKKFLVDVGIPEKNIRFRQHMKTEIAHYAADCWDVEVLTERFGWIEVVGIADRTDFDLMAHEKQSGVELGAFVQYEKPMKVKMTVLEPDMAKIGPKYRGIAGKIIDAVASCSRKEIDSFIKNKYLELTVEGKKIMLENDELAVREKEKTVSGEKIIPHVIEPSYGIDRILYCILESAYTKKGERTIMKFRDSISPIKVAVFPLVAKEKLVKAALKILDIVKGSGILAIYDDSDSIGRRYARVDEIGVPYAITVDFEGLEDGNVTLRERDSTGQ
ncbi:MAG: glycine--tRNA ligase, partial [Candidatus Hydrothermarchaeaceae archaeon]